MTQINFHAELIASDNKREFLRKTFPSISDYTIQTILRMHGVEEYRCYGK